MFGGSDHSQLAMHSRCIDFDVWRSNPAIGAFDSQTSSEAVQPSLPKLFTEDSSFKMSIVGKYERVSAEHYEEFLKALDVNFLLRKAATCSTPVMEVIIRY